CGGDRQVNGGMAGDRMIKGRKGSSCRATRAANRNGPCFPGLEPGKHGPFRRAATIEECDAISIDAAHEGHTVHLEVYHLIGIWCPNQRRRTVLGGPVRDRLEQIMPVVATENEWELIRLAIPPDLFHRCLRARPKILLSAMPRRSTGRRSPLVCEAFAHLLKLPSLRTRSCFLSTASTVRQEIIPAVHRKAIEDVSERVTTVPFRL